MRILKEMVIGRADPLSGMVACRFDQKDQELSALGPLDGSERFPLASVTKTFTSHLCLGDRFKEQLDMPIKVVLPYFCLQDPEATRELTPRDALCHFSGLAPHTTDWVRCDLSREKYIRERLPLLPPEGPFREKHRYSNLMYAVLGQWLEEIDGRSWEDQISQEILAPLNLTHTAHLDENWIERAPSPMALNDSGELEVIPSFYARKQHLIAPASEMIGTMSDLATWGQFLLSLNPEDERWCPHNRITVDRPFSEFGPLDYGLGWRLDTVNGEPRVWHSGQCSGYTTLLSLAPERKTGLALATNRSDAVEALHAVDLILGFSS